VHFVEKSRDFLDLVDHDLEAGEVLIGEFLAQQLRILQESPILFSLEQIDPPRIGVAAPQKRGLARLAGAPE
jgi:hypothetical protein